MGRTLLIDNYDSFTHNLYALIATTSGQPPLVIRNDAVNWAQAVAADVDRIIISPGPGRPQRPADLGLSAQAILSGRLPVLGVCLGHQAIGLLCGATVDLAREPVHGRRSAITHLGIDLFAGIPSPFQAVRYHSLAVTDLPEELQALAWSEDGTLMGLRHRTRPLWGVQFHPESILTEHGAALLKRFFELTAGDSPAVNRGQPPRARQRSPPRATAWHVLAMRMEDYVGPGEVFAKFYARSEAAFWLDSARAYDDDSRFSYMGDSAGPHAEVVRYRCLSAQIEVIRRNTHLAISQDVFSYLDSQTQARHASVPCSLPFGFTGGYVGYFGYESRGALLKAGAHAAETPDACWIFADRIIVFDHAEHALWLVCVESQPALCRENEVWVEQARRALGELSQENGRAEPGTASREESPELRWRHDAAAYRGLIRRALEYIRQGESYEVCLTNQLSGTCRQEPFEVYRALRAINPARYGAFLKVAALSVLCSSPELFLDIAADGTVESKPIKGTARREADPAADDRNARELAQSAKNIAENLMIVDLLRNDLNRVCEPGSVQVPSIFAVERHASVHQLVSTVRGRLRADVTNIDCIRAAFPGGSMTGAPKVRTLSILDTLERGPRGVYSGALGYLSTNGSAKLNIVIRTIVINGHEVNIGTGGAIIALSDPEEELTETLLKIAPLLRALGCRCEPG